MNIFTIYFQSNYMPLIIFFISSIFIASFLILLPSILSFTISEREKMTSYECGFVPFVEAYCSFDVHFIVVAILFLLFDFELLLLVPFVLGAVQSLNMWGGICIINLVLCLFLLLTTFVYEYLTKVLNWPLIIK